MKPDVILKYDLLQIQYVVQQCIEYIKNVSVVTFTGSLGAGKTTLISEILKKLGVSVAIVSPTFTYMNIYKLADGRIAYHFDLYRLASLEAFEQAGFVEYLYQENSVCFIEWPAIIMPLLKHSLCKIEIDFVDFDTRKLKLKIIE